MCPLLIKDCNHWKTSSGSLFMYSCYVSLAMIVLAPIIRHKRIKDVAINVYTRHV